MKLFITLLISILSFSNLFSQSSQQNFRRDYTHISIYDNKTKKWGDPELGNNTFVFNFNSLGDVQHFRPNGEIVTYKKPSGVERDKTINGNEYQIVSAIDEDGYPILLQLFDDPDYGLRIFWSEDIKVHFFNY